MENKFKDKMWQIVSVILAASLILSIINMNDLSEQMTNLQNSYNSMVSDVKSEMQNLYERIDDLVNEQSNAVLSYNCEVGTFNAEDKTVSAKITVVPKTFGDSTVVKIKFGENTLDALKNDNNEFTTDFTVDLFDEIENATVYVTNNGETAAQNINVSTVDLYKKFIPSATATFSGTSSRSSFSGKTSIKGTVSIHIENTDYSNIESCKLLVSLNNSELESKTVDVKSGNTSIEFNNSYVISKNDQLEIWLVAKDSLGYEHRDYIYGITENTDNTQAEIAMPDGELIFDLDNNQIIPKTEQ